MAGLALSTAVPAQAATDTLDQSQTVISNSQQLGVMAQTFTAGMTGQIDRVSLASDTPYGFTNLHVAIQTRAADGSPSGTALGSTSFQGSLGCCQGFHDFSFKPGVPVTAGTHYAIVVQVYVGLFNWYDSGWWDAYPGGQLYVSCFGCGAWYSGSSYGQDFAFETWVATSTNQAPVVTAGGSSVSATEGTAATKTGSYSDPDGDTVTLTASPGAVTKTGTSAGTWTWTGPAPSDEGSYVTTIWAADGGGLTGTSSFTVAVTEVAPTATITGFTAAAPLVLTAGEAVSFAGSFSDQGVLDSHTVTWNFGDGGASTATYGPGGAAALSTSHTYAAAGTFDVTLTVADDDGAVGQAATQVTVQTPQAAIAAISGRVQGIASLNAGQKDSLTAKLQAATAALNRGDTTAANNQLHAFLNELQAYLSAGEVSSAEAADLRSAIHAVQTALGVFNRFLSWWSVEA